MKDKDNWIWVIGIIVLLSCLSSCTGQTIDRPVPFEYEFKDSTLTVYDIDGHYMIYYSPEVFAIGWGKYDWDPYHTGPVCPDKDGRMRTVIALDERTIIRMSTLDWDYITTVQELKQRQ